MTTPDPIEIPQAPDGFDTYVYTGTVYNNVNGFSPGANIQLLWSPADNTIDRADVEALFRRFIEMIAAQPDMSAYWGVTFTGGAEIISSPPQPPE